MNYMVQVQGKHEDHVDDFDSWDDVIFEFPDLGHDFYPGSPIEFQDGNTTITIYSYDDWEESLNDSEEDFGYDDDGNCHGGYSSWRDE